ncbi:MAG: SRPBCC domain-containing protein [Acidimicrobiales bacterium]
MRVPVLSYEIHIRAPVSDVWRAITDGDQTVQYFYRTRVESSWEDDSRIEYRSPDGHIVGDGNVLAHEEPLRLDMTFHARWDETLESEGPVRMVWLLEPQSETVTKLTVEYYGFEPDSVTMEHFQPGIAYILSGLKTLVETGEPLGF